MPKPITDTEWRHLQALLDNIGPILNKQREELANLASERAALKDTRCTGRQHWRDLRDSHKKPKLYIIHATDTACPIHGAPQQRGRIRTYIGTNPQRKQRAINALQNNEAYKRLDDDYKKLDGRIRALIYLVSRVYWTLGLTVPKPEQDNAQKAPATSPKATQGG